MKQDIALLIAKYEERARFIEGVVQELERKAPKTSKDVSDIKLSKHIKTLWLEVVKDLKKITDKI
jgi:hypothetical protein